MATYLGTVGAYVYILLHLGQRNFQRDITSGAAVWCAVTLALGPVMAVVVAYLWEKKDDTTTGWAVGSVFFLAGLSPRYLANVIEEAARRLLSSTASVPLPARITPLTQVRGITLQVQERLNEEGIFDAHGLAAANPNRLFRNTSFDIRHILAWIDEAILITDLPKHWEKLEEQGINGAVDLALYGRLKRATEPRGEGPPEDPLAGISPDVKKLAELVGIDEVMLNRIIERLSEDKQVQRLYLLYQSTGDEQNQGQQAGA